MHQEARKHAGGGKVAGTGHGPARGTGAGTEASTGAFARLREALARAWTVSDFHHRHWLAHGVPHGWVPAHPDELERLPLVTKEDLLAAQAADAPWGGNLCVDPQDVAQVHLTSGTSGIGQERYACTAEDVRVMGASWGPQYQAIGLARGDCAVLTIPVSFFCAGLSALEGARLHGLVPIVTGVAAKDMILELLSLHHAAYLYGTESLLLQLASLARERGLAGRFGHLKGIQTVGTSPQLLAAAREVFGTRLFEVYGCTQAAAKIATTCSLGVGEGSMHFHDEHLYVETRDLASGRLVTEGTAEVIISTTYRQASPVFRFAMRDQVELVPAGACACGDPRPGYRPGTLARTDSMCKVRGVNVWPAAVERILFDHPAVREYRAVVRRREDGADELLLRVATRPGHPPGEGLAQALEDSVRRHTMVRPRVEFHADLPDSAGSYKVRRWADERERRMEATPAGAGSEGAKP